MKKTILLTAVLGLSLSFAETTVDEPINKPLSSYLTEAVDSVESARKDAVDALHKMVKNIDIARANSTVISSDTTISTQIVETDAIGHIAKSTASVEIAKVKAIASITKAIDTMNSATKDGYKKAEEKALSIIVQAVALVEVAKAKASKNIVEATQRVELSKTKVPNKIAYEKETLNIAKNITAVIISKSVADVEIAKSNSLIEIAHSMKSILPTLSEEDKENLKSIKAKASENISNYLTQLEVLKAEVVTKIAKEVAKIEIIETLNKPKLEEMK
ncbi:MAG: hypothetical protein QM493_11390 [Sulfurovum sp.]